MSAPTILIMAGGTGGHIYPALAVAEMLREWGVNIAWLGTARGLESELIPKAGFDLHYVEVAGLRGKGVLGWLAAPARIARAVAQSLQIMRRVRPDAVLGMGGFAAGPGGVAAWLSQRPLIIHEQNAVAGLTNRLLSRVARQVLEAFPGAFPERLQPRLTGNPIRRELIALPPPRQRYEGREGALRLLVLGGSLGASALNALVPAALAELEPQARPQVWHQTGRRHLEEVRALYARLGVAGEPVPYIEEMAEAFAWADLVLCRAGALTVSELTAVGLAALLVPFPHAVDDHQTHNATHLVRAGAGVLLPQATLSAARLADTLREFHAAGRERLLAMAEAARGLARPEATREVAELCLILAGAKMKVSEGNTL